MTVHDSRILTGHNSPTGTEARPRAPPCIAADVEHRRVNHKHTVYPYIEILES